MMEQFESLGFAPYGVIVVICLIVGIIINKIGNEKVKRSIPAIMACIGAGLGVVMFFTSEQFAITAGEFWWALAIGGVSGVAATGIHQIWKQTQKESENITIEQEVVGEIKDTVDSDNNESNSSIG